MTYFSHDEIEVGSVIWLKDGFQADGYPRAGTVIDNFAEGEKVPVVRFFHGNPVVDLWDLDELVDEVSCNGAGARNMADNLFRWMARQRKLGASDRAKWSTIAATLANVGSVGSLLPRSERRYQAQREQARRDQAS